MAQLQVTMRGGLATPFKHTHCYTCHSKNAKGLCGHCGVATYCNHDCAKEGWVKHGHAATCGSYSRLVSAVVMASSAPLGWPAHLETDAERAGFDLFVRERGPSLGVPNPDAVPPMGKAQLLLMQIWKTLTDSMKNEWGKKAARAQNDNVTGFFNLERAPFINRDLAERRFYPDDTLLKQIWRNLVKSERQTFIRMTGDATPVSAHDTKRKERSSPEPDSAEADANYKRLRLSVDMISNYMFSHEEGLPTELIMAIINNLPSRDVAATAGSDKRLNQVVWQHLYMLDIAAPAKYNPAASEPLLGALVQEARRRATADKLTTDADYKWLYMAVATRVSEGLAKAIIGDLAVVHPHVDPTPTRYFILWNAATGKPLFEGRTMPTMHRFPGAWNYEDTIDQYNVRHADDLDWYNDYIEEGLSETERVEAGKIYMGKALRADLPWNTARHVMRVLQQDYLSEDQIKRYYGKAYWRNGIILREHNGTVYKPGMVGPYSDLAKAMRDRRFGWDPTDVARLAEEMRRAFEVFFFEMFMQGTTLVSLSTATLQLPRSKPERNSDGESDNESGDESDDDDDDDDHPKRGPIGEHTVTSLLTGAVPKSTGAIDEYIKERFEPLLSLDTQGWDDMEA